VEVALKIAWQWWRNQGAPRSRLIAFEGAYHGDTMGAMALGERSLFTAPFDSLLFEVARAPWPATWWDDDAVERKEAEALDHLERLLETPTAAVILEPLLQGASGMRQVRPEFLREVERRVRQAGALLIADEVLMGFGRGGALFASTLAGLTPDLMALSKGLTGGFLPMGVTMASERLHAGFIGTDPALTLYHGHSFTANPLGCAAALASLDVFQEEKTLEKLPLRTERLRAGLAALKAAHPVIHETRQCGFIAGIELRQPDGTRFPPQLRVGEAACLAARAHGLLTRPILDTLVLMPPLCTGTKELDHAFAALDAAISTIPGIDTRIRST
jgi:adenosylmethionine-8-amino-7-oxononanoate aminotransferase